MAKREQADIIYTLDRASFNQGRNAKYSFKISEEGIADTIIAQGPGAIAVIDD